MALQLRITECKQKIAAVTAHIELLTDRKVKAQSLFVTKQLQIDNVDGDSQYDEIELQYAKSQIVADIASHKAGLTLAKAQLKRWQTNLAIAETTVATVSPVVASPVAPAVTAPVAPPVAPMMARAAQAHEASHPSSSSTPPTKRQRICDLSDAGFRGGCYFKWVARNQHEFAL